MKRKLPAVSPAYAVVVDGETEVWYLQMLKRNERDIRVSIKPEIPSKKSITEQFNLVCELAVKEFTKVFWLLDLDTVIRESNAVIKGKSSPLLLLEQYRQQLTNNYPNAIIIINNPCLEFWFLLHFENTTKVFNSCMSAVAALKTHIKNYEKSQRFFTQYNNDIYMRLKPYLKQALQNSKALGRFNSQYPSKALCEMQLFFMAEELRSYFE